MPRVVKGSMSFKPAFKPKPKTAASKPKPQQPAPAVAAPGDAGRDQNQNQERSSETTGTLTGPGRDLPSGDTIEVVRSTRGGLPSGDTIEIVRPSVPRPRMASPPPSLLTPPATQTQTQTQVEDRAYSLPPFVPPPGRVPVRFERDALPPTPGPTQQHSQPQASSSRPTASPSRSPPRSLSPQHQATPASTPRPPPHRSPTPPPVSRYNSEPEEEHTVVPVPITIKANEFPHRMTDDQLLPTPGFVLPSLKQVGGGPRHGPPVKPLSSGSSSLREARTTTRTRANGKGKRREGTGEGSAEEEERSMDDEEEDSDDSEDAYDPQGKAGRKKRRAAKRKERARTGRDGSQEDGVEEDREGASAGVGVGKKRKRTKKTAMEALDPSLVADGQQGGDSETDDGSEDDEDEDDDEETGDNANKGNKKKAKRGKKARKAKRLRVNIRDDLDEEQLATLQPGQAIGEEIDEETMTMADLAAGPGQGRISGKAIKIQQGREEIQRRKEEEQERRIRFRVDRETKMRGMGGQAAKQAAAAENEDQNEGAEGEQTDGAQAGQAGEEDQEEEDIEDYDMNEKGDGDEDMGVDGTNADDADAGDLDLDEDDDDQEFIVNQHARGLLQLDDNGTLVVNTQLNRQQILNESMNEGNVFEDNDDLKFTNSMSHSKRASVIRWTKPMNNKLMTLLRQHGPVYETIAKIMALTYPAMERTHVANHMRTLNAKDPELLTWALSKENKLEIDMTELKQVYPGIDFEAPLPDITMYFNPNIDPSEIRAMKRKQAASNKPMTEQDKKKQARRAALSKKKQEKMRQLAMMGTVEEGEEVGDEELAAMRRQPGLPL